MVLPPLNVYVRLVFLPYIPYKPVHLGITRSTPLRAFARARLPLT